MKTQSAKISCLCIFLTLPVSISYAENLWTLDNAKNLEQKQDYFRAAIRFFDIYNHDPDIKTKSEALFRLVECGNKMAEAFQKEGKSPWDKTHDTDFQQYRTLAGLEFDIEKYSELIVCETDDYLKRITELDPNSEGGEIANYRLIGREGPRDAVDRAKKFMRIYPKSKYTHDVHFMLAMGYNDLWFCTQESEYMEFLSDTDKQNPEALRLLAIKYFEDVKDNEDKLTASKKELWDRTINRVIKDLKNRKNPRRVFFIND